MPNFNLILSMRISISSNLSTQSAFDENYASILSLLLSKAVLVMNVELTAKLEL